MKARFTADDRTLQQSRLEALFDLTDAVRDTPPSSEPPPVPASRCGARMGRDHDFTMKGSDGHYRCWFCCRRKE